MVKQSKYYNAVQPMEGVDAHAISIVFNVAQSCQINDSG